MNSSFLLRLRIIIGVFIFLMILVATKLFFIQVVHGEAYSERADRQYATPTSSIFDRGNIFFQTKDGDLVSAATMQTVFTIVIRPKEIVDAEVFIEHIRTVLPDIDVEKLKNQLAKKSDPYEEIATKRTKEEADAISALTLPGVYVYKEKNRFYPGGVLAAHTLGFVAYDGDTRNGRYGVERYYNSTLERGEQSLYVNFFAEIFTNIKQTVFTRDEREGDIVLTIDPKVQGLLERELADANERWSAEYAGGMVIDPKTGELLAMARVPAYNLNAFGSVEDPLIYSNPSIENVFEFGSVIKPLTMAAGLDANVVTPTTTYNDKGFVEINGKTINNFDKVGRGENTTMQDVLNESLNTGSIFVMQQLGREKFKDYLLGFGIGEKTGIDLPSETTGLISNLKSTRELEYATAAFGQGIAITPVEALRAFTTLANGGYLVTPHVGREIRYLDGTKKTFTYEKGEQVISPETSKEITAMLVEVSETLFETYQLSFPNYSMAIKTGTAQISREDGGGYYEDKHLHSIFGYFPAYNPEFLVFLYVKDPKNVKYAAQTLSKPLLNTAKFLTSYYDIPPDNF